MTWNDYKDWLETNIIETITNEEEEEQTVLQAGVAAKYSLANPEALATALVNLCLSIENLEKDNTDYHSLPLISDMENDDKLKSWNELFPQREQALFGSNDQNQPLDPETFTALRQIYEDWCQAEERGKKLEGEFADDEMFGEILLRANLHHIRGLLKRINYEQKLVNWLAEYNKLAEQEQEDLKERKEKIERCLQYLREELQYQEEPTQSWFSQLNWTKITLWGGGGLFLLLLLIFLKKLFKNG